MEKILKLNVNNYWYGLIDRGEINFDYRMVKPHWVQRLTTCNRNETKVDVLNKNLKEYNVAEFFIPYTNNKRMRFEIKFIKAYKGSDVGLKCYDACFIIELGNRLR